MRSRLIEEIAAIEDPSGQNIGSIAHRPDELYRATRGVAPDLIVYFGNLDWRSVGSVGYGSIYTFDNDTGPDDANHAQHGIFMLKTPGQTNGARRLSGCASTTSRPPSSNLYGLPIPAEMQGRVIARCEPTPRSPFTPC